MVSPTLFQSYPPFPDNVATVEVPKISLAKLLSSDKAQSEALFHICRTMGFFLLDLEGDPVGEKLLEDIDAVFGVAKKVFDLEIAEKSKYQQDATKGNFMGWKQVGIMKTDSGAPDRCEFYAISQDDVLGNISARPNAPPIESHRPTITSFMERAHAVITLILSILDTHLALPSGTFSSLMRPDKPSGTLLRLIRYEPQPQGDRRTSLLSHTDMGTITFLCSVLGGLQILPPGGDPLSEADWRYIRPAPNCAVINLGDTLVEWSGGILRSNVHRVTYAPGKQAECTRYSIAYLARANKNVSMKRLQSDRILSAEDGEKDMDVACEEWELNKSKALTAGADCARSRGGKEMRQLATTVTV